MRYKIDEQPTILGKFNTGDTVTITLYDLSDESSETLTSNACNELGSTGVFYWSTSNITTQPTAFTEYCWVMTNSTTTQYGKIVLGGYPDTMPVFVADQVWDEVMTGHHIIDDTFGKSVYYASKIEKNRWKIFNNQFIVYDDDATTPLLKWNLLDSAGSPTEINPYERALTTS